MQAHVQKYDRSENKQDVNDPDVETCPSYFLDCTIEIVKISMCNKLVRKVVSPNVVQMLCGHISKYMGSSHIFPGCLAMSILRSDLQKLASEKYVLLPKTDGVRYIMYLFRDRFGGYVCGMYERSGSHYNVHLTFDDKIYDGTILDGELVQCDDGTFEYQIFDCMVFANDTLMERSYIERMSFPNLMIENDMYEYKKHDPFKVIVKQCITKQQARSMFETIDRRHMSEYNMDKSSNVVPLNRENIERNEQDNSMVKYPTDGLILVCNSAPYRVGNYNKLFKFKVGTNHTVDFKVNVIETKSIDGYSKKELSMNITQDKTLIECCRIPVTKETLLSIGVSSDAALDKSIVECAWDEANNGWRLFKVRKDKLFPNNIDTYNLTMQNIKENIVLEELLEHLKE